MSDITLNCTEAGSGTPLVLLHGNGGSHEAFAEQIPYFSQYYRVLAPDTRGHGATPRGSAPFTLSQFADDLATLLEEKGIDKADILGFSDGANIAMLFALKYPEKVDHLILNSGNCVPSGMQTKFWLAVCVRHLFCRKTAEREMLGLMANQPHITAAQLKTLRMPTLVIAGDHDLIRMRHTRRIARCIAGSTLVILPGTHGVLQERPRAFNAIVHSFLTTF